MLEETLSRALKEAGDGLAFAMRSALRERGMCSALEIAGEGLRLSLVSRNGDVARAESGAVGCPPTAPLRASASAHARDVVRTLARCLKEGFDERGGL